MAEEQTPPPYSQVQLEKLHSLLTPMQLTLLRGANEGDLSRVRVYYEPIVGDFIGEVHVPLGEPDSRQYRVYSVTPTGARWDDYTEIREEV